ncbi:DUF4352 domain-containing protein [Myxococcota bacterium]|nr:DUF4352 domain-containing protein [Myxococcota bacterium]
MARAHGDPWPERRPPGGSADPDETSDPRGPGRGWSRLRAVALVALVVTLFVLGVSWMLTARRGQVEALHRVAGRAAQARPAVELVVEEQAVRDGAVATRISVADLDLAGRPGARRDFWVAGGTARIGAARARVVAALAPEDPLDLPFLASLAGEAEGAGQAQSLLPVRGAPGYHAYRGDEEERVARVEQLVWDAVRAVAAGTPSPGGYEASVARGEEAEVDLVLGDRWIVEADHTGRISARAARTAVPAFDPAPVLTRSSLEFSVAQVDRMVAFAGQVDPRDVFYRVTLRARNRSPQALAVDTSLLRLVDSGGGRWNPESADPLALGPGAGASLRLVFRVPPEAAGLRLEIPGEEMGAGERGRPATLPLQSPEPGIGDVVASGRVLLAVLSADRRVEAGEFVYEVAIGALNLSREPVALGPGDLSLADLRWEHAPPVRAEALSADLPPLEPRRLAARFPAGPSVFRHDPTLVIKDSGDPAAREARVRLSPPRSSEPEAVADYLDQVAAARHWAWSRELLGRNRGLLGWLGDQEARRTDAALHADAARRLFPDSGVFGGP